MVTSFNEASEDSVSLVLSRVPLHLPYEGKCQMSDLDVRTLYGGGRWCRRRMRGAGGDERRRRMKDIPTGKLGPAGSRILFVYIEVPYSCTKKIKQPIIYII